MGKNEDVSASLYFVRCKNGLKPDLAPFSVARSVIVQWIARLSKVSQHCALLNSVPAHGDTVCDRAWVCVLMRRWVQGDTRAGAVESGDYLCHGLPLYSRCMNPRRVS